MAETIVVEATTVPLLETQSAQITGTFSAKEVQSLRNEVGQVIPGETV